MVYNLRQDFRLSYEGYMNDTIHKTDYIIYFLIM